MLYTVGIYFGASSARSIVAHCAAEAEVGNSTLPYSSGDAGKLLDPADYNFARQPTSPLS